MKNRMSIPSYIQGVDLAMVHSLTDHEELERRRDSLLEDLVEKYSLPPRFQVGAVFVDPKPEVVTNNTVGAVFVDPRSNNGNDNDTVILRMTVGRVTVP